MERHSANALAVARHLEGNRKIKRVIYPGLESHPQHALAKRQMQGFGGIVTIDVDADESGVRRFLEGLRLFTLAESLGGVESLAGASVYDEPWFASARTPGRAGHRLGAGAAFGGDRGCCRSYRRSRSGA